MEKKKFIKPILKQVPISGNIAILAASGTPQPTPTAASTETLTTGTFSW